MLGRTLRHPSSCRVANKTRHLDSCSPVNKLSFGHFAPSPPAPDNIIWNMLGNKPFLRSCCEHTTRHRRWSDLHFWQFLAELDNFRSRRCVILGSIWVWAKFVTIRLEARSALNKIIKSTQAWMSRTLDVNTLTIAGFHAMIFFCWTIFGRGDVWSWVQHESERSSWLCGSKLAVHWSR